MNDRTEEEEAGPPATEDVMAARIPAPSVAVYIHGSYDRDTGTVVNAELKAVEMLPATDGEEMTIGRDAENTVRIAAPRVNGMSRKAVAVQRSNGRYQMWVRSGSGGTVYLPGGRTLEISAATDDDPQPAAQHVELQNHTVVELVIGSFLYAHLVFDIPRASVLPPPSLEGDPAAPATVVSGHAKYVLTAADREMLVALCPDKVAAPPFGIDMTSTPAQAVRMLQTCARAYFEGKGAKDRYDADKLNQTIASFIRRMEEVEEAAHVEYQRRLSTLVEAFKEAGHAGTLGIGEWLSTRAEIIATLDFPMAVEMRQVREAEIARSRERRSEAGKIGARVAAGRRELTQGGASEGRVDARLRRVMPTPARNR